MNHLAIIIVNYRTAALTVDCLRSLSAAGKPKVIVVDNASGDDSAGAINAAIVRNGWSGWATVLAAQENRGFAAGNNLALRQILHGDQTPPEFILLLNPDTVVRGGAITSLMHFMQEHPGVGIAGSGLEEPDGTPQTSAFRFHNLLGEFDDGARIGPVSRLLSRWCIAPPPQSIPHPTDWVAGASMLIRTQVFRDIGLLDERFFMYYEEVDFCRRASKKGWPCWYVPQARIVHLVGKSSGVTDKSRASQPLPAYWFAARRHYFCKAHGRLYAAAAELAYLGGHALWRVRMALARQAVDAPPNRMAGGIQLIMRKALAENA